MFYKNQESRPVSCCPGLEPDSSFSWCYSHSFLFEEILGPESSSQGYFEAKLCDSWTLLGVWWRGWKILSSVSCPALRTQSPHRNEEGERETVELTQLGLGWTVGGDGVFLSGADGWWIPATTIWDPVSESKSKMWQIDCNFWIRQLLFRAFSAIGRQGH